MMSTLGTHFKLDNQNKFSNPKAVFKGEKYRITILSDILIRLEYDEAGIFFDNYTELVKNRNFPLIEFDVQEDNKFLVITTKHYRLQYLKEKPFVGSTFAPDSNLRINLLDTDKVWYFKHDEARNFGSVVENIDTKEVYISKAEQILSENDKTKSKNKNVKMDKIRARDVFVKRKGLYSTDGFVSIDDSSSLIIDNEGYLSVPEKKRIDTYVFLYRRDFGECLKDYFTLIGNPPLIPKYALGIWWYKDQRYDFDSIKDLVFNFNKYEIPVSTILLGEYWHIKDKNDNKKYVSGFTFDRDLFPNPKEFSDYLHDRGIRLGLKINPSEGIHPHEFKFQEFASELGITDNQTIPFNAFDKKFISAYLDKLINPLYNDGADFFFIDYLTRDSNQLTALNYYHINDFKKFNNNRGLELSRISGNAPASYPIYFSGETVVSWETLKKIPELTSRAANLGLTWYSHDIGGFKDGMEDQELYLRYVELGCFQPIFRFASTKGHYYKREPWRWDLKTFTIVKDYCTLRARLVSYLYAEGYKYHKIGTPVVQPLYYKVPEIYDEVLYRNEYYFGSELLVAPITKPKDLIMNRAIEQIYLPEGTWYDFKTGKKYIGNKRYVMFFKDEDYPVFAKSGSIIILNDLEDNINATNAPKSLEVHVFPGKDNIYNLYEDDGVSSLYKDGYYIVTRFDYNYLQNNYTLIIRPFEGKSGIIPETRNYKIRFRNTKKASNVVVMLEADVISYESYIEDNDFVIEVKDVPTVRQLTINCKGNDIEIDAVRIINEDIDSIIADIPIKTTLKDILSEIMFSDKDYSDKRIAIKRLKRQGLEDKFVRVFLRLLEFTKDI